MLRFSGLGKDYSNEKIGKMTFSEDNLQLIDRSGNLIENVNIYNIGRIVFLKRSGDSGISSNLINPDYTFQETERGFSITIDGEDFACLYSMNGYLLNTFRNIEGRIDISTHELSAGIYLLQLKHQVIKSINKYAIKKYNYSFCSISGIFDAGTN